MNCHDAKDLLHAYVDGELDLVRNQELEKHVQECPACSVAAKNARTLKGAIGGVSLYFHSPPQLRRQVLAAIGELAQPAGRVPWWQHWRTWTAIGVTCLAITASSIYHHTRPTPNDRLLDELRAGHVRSLMTRHLTDVASADRAVVQPWFEGKLDFVPNVANLEAGGFSLVGGRLDFLNDRPMAALVYKRDDHLINVFIWRMTCEEAVPDKVTPIQGLNLAEWSNGGIGYAAVSDLKPEELRGLAASISK